MNGRELKEIANVIHCQRCGKHHSYHRKCDHEEISKEIIEKVVRELTSPPSGGVNVP